VIATLILQRILILHFILHNNFKIQNLRIKIKNKSLERNKKFLIILFPLSYFKISKLLKMGNLFNVIIYK